MILNDLKMILVEFNKNLKIINLFVKNISDMDKRIELYKKNLKEKKYLLNENLEYLSEGVQGKVFRIGKLGVIIKKINYEYHKEWIPILNRKNVYNDSVIGMEIKASEKIKPQNDVNDKILEAEKKINYYQEDNLRLSNEVGTLSKRLDNTKHQLVSYESNKQQIMSEIKNLNNVISRSNIIDNKFGSTILESDKIIINEDGKVTKKIDQKIKNTNDINLLVREIFKK